MTLFRMFKSTRFASTALRHALNQGHLVIKHHSPLFMTRTFCDTAPQPFPTYLTSENIGNFRESFDTMLTDCDGVLWSSDMLNNYENIGQTVDHIRENGTKMLFVSNNSLLDRGDYQSKLKNLSKFHADVEDIFCVNYVTALYLREGLDVTTCYMIGTRALERELLGQGITVIGLGADQDLPSYHPKDIMKTKLDYYVTAVVVSFDEYFSYNKLVKASSYLREKNIHYVATSDKEMTIELGNHWIQPLTGTIVQAVSSASKRTPKIIGKPAWTMMECIMRKHIDVDLDRTIMVGDSLTTDIGFAKAAKIPSLLVLSGATSYEDLVIAFEKNQPMPEYYTDKFSDLLELEREII